MSSEQIFRLYLSTLLPTNVQLFVFGGRGLLQLGNRQIFSEFWQYVPPTGTWQLVIAPSTNTAYGPVGRYAHTLSTWDGCSSAVEF
jgi:N-acetylneuraminic acid mutarotase